jgi:hypothetical protein
LRFRDTRVRIVACGASNDAEGGAAGTGAVALHAEAAPLADFKYDTGLLPLVSPAQVQLKLSAGGGLTISAAADPGGDGLVGTKGGGKVALDLHVKVDGRLKVTSFLKNYDGDLPGLKDIDIPIRGEVPFDGLLLGDGESASATADLPETTLPEIPLGAVPGALVITVMKGSTLTSTFHGTCVSVAGGQATYTGESKTTGKLRLKGTIVLKLPAPLNKSIDLPVIEVPVPGVTTKVEGAAAAAGVGDSKQGACGPSSAAPGKPAEKPGSSSSGGSSSGGSSSGGSSSGGSTSGGGSSSGGSSSGSSGMGSSGMGSSGMGSSSGSSGMPQSCMSTLDCPGMQVCVAGLCK